MSKARARLLREKQTDAERELWRRLRDCRLSGWKFKRQVPKGPYIADFCCAEANLIIELDGGQHSDEAAVAYDARRTEFLQNSGYRVVRFWNSEIFTNLDGVIDAIWARLEEPPLPNDERHSLSPSGRGLG